MPLPASDTTWPPRQLAGITPKLNEWAAWWTGRPADLAKIYQSNTASLGPKDRPSQMRGGVVGTMARWWWGRPSGNGTQIPDRTHIALAADIATAGADLLFAQPINVTVSDKTTQDRLGEVLSEDAYATFTTAAEQSAALGGVYLQTVADEDVGDSAFLTTRSVDQAIPEFRHGRLVAVTFWEVLEDDGREVVRHLERHELRDKIGVVEHAVYSGTQTSLGRRISLADNPDTQALVPLVDEDGLILAGRTPGLDVVHVANTPPDGGKAWWNKPGTKGWGAADIDGLEMRLDNLDEAWASWMRDIRLGKARVLLAQYMLDDLGAGSGAMFDMDREIFSPLKMSPNEDRENPITEIQFKIRFQEHKATVDEIVREVIGSAGYSPRTFGRQDDGAAVTATEVDSDEGQSARTRGRKVRQWTPQLRRILTKLIEVDAEVFGNALDADDLRIEFPDESGDAPLEVAQTAQALRVAQAASTKTLVQIVHPDWDEPRVDAEVEAITNEKPEAMTDPFAITS